MKSKKRSSSLTVTDQFCGAGGSSQGASNAFKKLGITGEIKLALNHWRLAIETHNTNFPNTLHDCTDISACDPRRYPSTDILLTSPECTNHSLANGKKKLQAQMQMFDKGILDPAAERSRATMWDVPRFAEYHNYPIIIVENVVDARKWILFDAWLMAMHKLEYMHECVYLNSMHVHPTPQSRDRMYVVFWKKANRKPNLNITPLAPCPKCNTDVSAVQTWKDPRKRFGKYRQQYVYTCPGCACVVEPYYYAAFNAIDWTIPTQRIGDRKIPLKPSTVARIEYGLKKFGKQPLVIATRYTSGIDYRVKAAASEPMGTQPGDVSHGILSPFIPYTDQSSANDGLNIGSSTGALRTQTTSQVSGVVVPGMMIESKGKSKARGLNAPAACATSKEYLGLMQMPGFFVNNYGGGYKPHFAPHSLQGPLSTAKTTSHCGLVQMPFTTEMRGTGKARTTANALSTVTAGGNHHGLITTEAFNAFIGYYYGNHQTSGLHEALGSCTTKERHFMVTHGTETPAIEDCYYRMLKSAEIGRAMAFGSDYIVCGNERDRVKQYGNAVTPPASELLVERCIQSLL